MLGSQSALLLPGAQAKDEEEDLAGEGEDEGGDEDDEVCVAASRALPGVGVSLFPIRGAVHWIIQPLSAACYGINYQNWQKTIIVGIALPALSTEILA